MIELLHLIGDSLLYINVSILVIYLILHPKITAFFVVMSGVCILGLLHMLYKYQLIRLFGIEEYIELVRYLWYFGYALSDFLLVYICITVFDKKNLISNKTTNFILVTYLVLGANQLCRYADKYIFETNLLSGFYQVIIPTLYIGISTVAALFLLSALLSGLRKSTINR